MGRVYSGAPQRLLALLKSSFSVHCFVETGTFYGGTAYLASRIFDRVISIENSDSLYRQASEKLAPVPNIQLIHGHSGEVLPQVVAGLEGPSVFWLDAHWCFGETAGFDQPCPILDEIAAVNRSPHEHILLIDDARGFLSPPEPPHKVEHWPDITTVLNALNAFPKPRYIVVIEDILIAVPLAAKPVVAQYCQQVNLEIFKRLYG